MEKYYIYSLSVDDKIFYIGKTKNLKERLNKHKKESILKRTHKEKFINKTLLNGGNIDINIIDEVNFGEEDFWEIYWISEFKKLGYDLYNTTSGGEGGDNWSGKKHSEETKEKLRKIRYDQISKGNIHKSIGELNGRSKLKSENIIEIRELFKNGWSYGKLSIKFKVSKPVIRKIILGINWKHV